MTGKSGKPTRLAALLAENQDLRERLEEAEETLRAIREGQVDAIVVSGSHGEQIFSLNGSERIYRLIVETMKEAALSVTSAGEILFCNRQFEAFVGTPMEQILGHPLDAFVAPDQRDLVAALLRRSQVDSVKNRILFQGPTGSTAPAHVSATVLRHPDDVSICLVATDLTDLETSTATLRLLQQQQEALEKARGELETRVRERTAELDRTVEKLQAEVSRRSLAEEALWQRSLALRALASELSLAEQRERRRVAEVLHDDLQQLLVGAWLQLSGLLRRSDKAVIQAATTVEDLVAKALAVTSSLSLELNPPILNEGGLVPALQWLATWMREKYGLQVDLSVSAAEAAVPLENDVRVLLFQMVRELLLNVLLHARVRTAAVEIGRQGDQIRVCVADRGAGFEPAKLASRSARHFGLFSIREQVEALGGSLAIDSSPGSGSRFTLLVPMAPPATETPRPGRAPSESGETGEPPHEQREADPRPGGG